MVLTHPPPRGQTIPPFLVGGMECFICLWLAMDGAQHGLTKHYKIVQKFMLFLSCFSLIRYLQSFGAFALPFWQLGHCATVLWRENKARVPSFVQGARGIDTQIDANFLT